MKRLLATLVFLVSLSAAFAQNENRMRLLRQLDDVISERWKYGEKREREFEEIKERLENEGLSCWKKWEECGRLVDGYISFQTDSAVIYALKKKEYAIAMGDSLKILETDLNLAQIYSITGLYTAALEMVGAVSDKCSTPFLKSYAHNIRTHVYETQYHSVDNVHVKEKYYNLLKLAYEMMLDASDAESGGSSYYYTKANLLALEGRYADARQWLERNEEDITKNAREEAIYWFLMGNCCLEGAGTREEAEICFAKSAIKDITLGIKEHNSLLNLAQLLYADGDISRAHTYLKVSLEDAQYCNSQKRMVGASQFFPIVDNAWTSFQKRNQRILYAFLILAVLFVIVLTSTLFYINRLYRAKRIINRQLKAANAKLKDLNGRLEEANIIKETYIVHYIDYCLDYIEQMDAKLKKVFRLARGNDSETLMKELDFTSVTKENLDKFYEHFDNTFLHLFPDFVEEYNKLLIPESRLRPKRKLNTELRIYALVRLGITDNAQIARFLHCSVITVYNNKTMARNKAVDRDGFEDRIASLCSIENAPK